MNLKFKKIYSVLFLGLLLAKNVYTPVLAEQSVSARTPHIICAKAEL